MAEKNPTLTAEAVDLLIADGWGAFPLGKGTKHPATPNGFKDAVYGESARMVVDGALASGGGYGLHPPKHGFVLDFDTGKDERVMAYWEKFRAEHPEVVSGGLLAETPHQGKHLYLGQPKVPDAVVPQFQGNRAWFGPLFEAKDRNGNPIMMNGVDSRVHRKGYIVGPGSQIVEDGETLAYRVEALPEGGVLGSLPPEIGKELRKGSRASVGKGKKRKTGKSRHDRLKVLALVCWKQGKTLAEFREAAGELNADFDPPMEDERLADETKRLYGWCEGRIPQVVVFDASSIASWVQRKCAERGLAYLREPGKDESYRQFISTGSDLTGMDREGYWEQVDRAVLDAAFEDIAEKLRAAVGELDPNGSPIRLTDRLMKDAIHFTLDRYQAEVIVHLNAKHRDRNFCAGVPWDWQERVVAFAPDEGKSAMVFDFDRDTGGEVSEAMRPERYDDLIRTRTAFRPEKGETPIYDRFMEQITLGRADLRADLERIPATAMLKRPRQRMLFFYGEKGGNGKGTLVNLWKHILGGLYLAVPDEWRGSSKFWQADIEGRSLAVFDDNATETRRFPWHSMKALTGAHALTAAHKHKRQRTFPMACSFVLVVNELPAAGSKQDAQGRRVAVFPFDYHAPSATDTGEDETLPERLRAEAPALLWRLFERAREIGRNGDFDPMPSEMGQTVRAATDAGWAAISEVAGFVAAECYVVPDARTLRSEVWARFKGYKAEHGLAVKQRELYEGIRQTVGVVEKRTAGGPVFAGLRLRQEGEAPQASAAAPSEREPTGQSFDDQSFDDAGPPERSDSDEALPW